MSSDSPKEFRSSARIIYHPQISARVFRAGMTSSCCRGYRPVMRLILKSDKEQLTHPYGVNVLWAIFSRAS